jgi:hypothetical protein
VSILSRILRLERRPQPGRPITEIVEPAPVFGNPPVIVAVIRESIAAASGKELEQ